MVSFFPGHDGVSLAYRSIGEGRPLVLLHGLAADGTMWLRHGQALSDAGFRLILPDFRGHGESAKPHEATAYPPDVMADDGLALVEHLGLDDYDLGGYSLGARIVVRMLVRGATPGRAVVAGQGLREVNGTGGGAGAMLRRVIAGAGTHEAGSAEDRTEQWLRASGVDPVALVHAMDSIVATPDEALHDILVPTLVVVGAEDERAVSAQPLADALPRGALAMVPGDHATALAAPELTAAIVTFLS
jgi:pimeloyl-ACP methyl ester carboxylesterase